ncbi:MAG: HAD-IIIA family hydrolase [Clostridiales bacterium]|jgi:D-glycero-D-manno-heptose 1,7-bisphosphate phosphatase|nr:HAD-IIIA family hydrolase [Clostridiales bacterium]
MRTAILAGGKGTRIGSMYPELPKPMFPMLGKPLLQWHIEQLKAQGLLDITLIVGYKSEAVTSHFGNGKGFGVNISYITEDQPLGTGGALPLLPKEETLLLLGDVYYDVDFREFLKFHKEKEALITLFAHPNSHPHDSDIVVVDKESRVIAWKSKKDKERGDLRNLVNAGLYAFSPEALPREAATVKDLEKDIVFPLVSSGKVFARRTVEYAKDMGTPTRIASVACDIESGVTSTRSHEAKRKAVFIDRDGTINIEDGFLTDPEKLKLLPGAAEAIKLLNGSPYLAICITNQPVIARGEVTFERLDQIHARLDTLLGYEGAYLDDLFFCPHHPHKGFEGEVLEYKIECNCRKPKPGLILEAARIHGIDLSQSYMIGDRLTDVKAGEAAGCTPLGIGLEPFEPGIRMYKSLLDAVSDILKIDNSGKNA